MNYEKNSSQSIKSVYKNERVSLLGALRVTSNELCREYLLDS